MKDLVELVDITKFIEGQHQSSEKKPIRSSDKVLSGKELTPVL
jgi:hypothetical protein